MVLPDNISRRALILFLAIGAGSTGAFAGEKSMQTDPRELRMKAFERKIDFDRAVLNQVLSEKIVFDWKTIGIPKHLEGWKLVGRDFSAALKGPRPHTTWEWAYRKNSEAVGIEIISHKAGDLEALREIVSLANGSSAVEPHYLKGPADLGTISAARPNGLVLYWAYRDLSFKVESTNKDTLLKTAYWLQTTAEKHRQQ